MPRKPLHPPTGERSTVMASILGRSEHLNFARRERVRMDRIRPSYKRLSYLLPRRVRAGTRCVGNGIRPSFIFSLDNGKCFKLDAFVLLLVKERK